MWKICGSISIGVSLCALTALGQGSISSAQMPGVSSMQPVAVPSNQNVTHSPGGGMLESNTFLEMANRVFDPSSDAMDFQEGSYSWKGRQFSLSDQRAFRARFERFLLETPSPESQEYVALMDEILDQISVSNENTDETIQQAWQMLFRASEYDADDGNSIIVANQIFNAWRIRKESRGTSLSQTEAQNLRKYQQEVVANRALAMRKLRERQQRELSATQRDKETVETEDDSQLVTESAFRALELAETEARIAALEAQVIANGVQAKLQFQSQIVAFVMQRRFQHALVLSSFYQLLFKGSQQQLEVGADELKTFLPNSDLSFTVDTMSYLASEAINDVNDGVEAVLAAYREDRRLIALERLQETFFLGEHLSELNSITVEQRRAFLDLYRGMLEARELAEAKDYKGVVNMAESLGQMAHDFPRQRVVASAEAAMSMSDMAVFAASQYRNAGQIDQARDELLNAIQIWPGNPSIREFQSETTRLATAGAQGSQIFDDLVQRDDRRGIYERRMELGFALAEDPERKQRLMQVVDQVARIDLLIAQAEELDEQGESFAAWELLESARAIDSNDGPMNRARAELAPRVANFIGYIDRAKQYEERRQSASALTAYLAAQQVYPASRICRIGIERVSDALMAQLSAPKNEAE